MERRQGVGDRERFLGGYIPLRHVFSVEVSRESKTFVSFSSLICCHWVKTLEIVARKLGEELVP